MHICTESKYCTDKLIKSQRLWGVEYLHLSLKSIGSESIEVLDPYLAIAVGIQIRYFRGHIYIHSSLLPLLSVKMAILCLLPSEAPLLRIFCIGMFMYNTETAFNNCNIFVTLLNHVIAVSVRFGTDTVTEFQNNSGSQTSGLWFTALARVWDLGLQPV